MAGRTVLDRVDLAQRLTDAEYQRRLPRSSRRGSASSPTPRAEKKRSQRGVFEGWDAAGKGGGIRRLTEAMDARALPRDPDRRADRRGARPPLPVALLAPHSPRRPRDDLRPLLVRAGAGGAGRGLRPGGGVDARLPGDQRLRGAARRARRRAHQVLAPHQPARSSCGASRTGRSTAYKQHKITDEDWRNREKWDAYEAAVNDMVVRTSTRDAPWTLVAGNDKRLARIQVLETVCERLERAL